MAVAVGSRCEKIGYTSDPARPGAFGHTGATHFAIRPFLHCSDWLGTHGCSGGSQRVKSYCWDVGPGTPSQTSHVSLPVGPGTPSQKSHVSLPF